MSAATHQNAEVLLLLGAQDELAIHHARHAMVDRQGGLANAFGCRNEETGAAHTKDLAGRDQGVYNLLRYLSVRLR